MKNVLIATLEYPPQVGGISTYLSYVAERFPSGRITVLAPEVGDAHEHDMRSPAIIYRKRLSTRFLRPRWLPALYWTWWFCRKERPDALVVSHVLPMGQVARFVRRTLGIPYVVIIHGMDVAGASAAGGRKKRAAQKTLAGAALVIANSVYTATWLESFGVDPKRAVIVPPPPSLPLEAERDEDDRRAMRRRLGAQDHEFLMLSAGRLVHRKGFDTCIRAAAEMKARRLPVRLAVVGEGPDRARLEKLTDDLGARDVVSFIGALDPGELLAAYMAADVFVMVPRAEGSDVEGYGIVYLEAGAAGTPVIGSRSGGVPEAVRHEETGLLVRPDDVQELIDAVERLRNDAGLYDRLAAAGRQRVLDEFGDDRQAKRFMAAVKRIAL